MRDFEVDKIARVENNLQEEQTLNWKSVLSNSLGKSEKQLISERSWAKLCQRMRDLCPETNWISIFEHSEQNNQRLILSMQAWLESLLATPEWPFPEQVILLSGGDKNPGLRIVFNNNLSKLPYAIPPKGITVSPFKDAHTSGWKILAIQATNTQQVGQA